MDRGYDGRLQRRPRRFVAEGCAAMLLLLAVGEARAQPRVQFAVEGHCPSHADVRRAFGEHVLPAPAAEPGAWLVQVEDGGSGGATLVLRTPGGEVASTRAIQSGDCPALAQAFAFIVLAHFVELRLIEPQPAPAPSIAPRARPPAAQPRPTALPDDPLLLGLAAGAGLGVGVAPGSAAPGLELALALGPQPPAWRARFAAQLAAPVQQQSATDRVEHLRSGVRLELGARWPLAARAWFDAGAGGGLTYARVTALDLPGRPATARLWPAVAASIALGLELGSAWSLRWATAAQLYPRTDRYRIEPEGVVGKSPKADVMTTLGLQFDALL